MADEEEARSRAQASAQQVQEVEHAASSADAGSAHGEWFGRSKAQKEDDEEKQVKETLKEAASEDSPGEFVVPEDLDHAHDYMTGGIFWNTLVAFGRVTWALIDWRKLGTLFKDVGSQMSKVTTAMFLLGLNSGFDFVFPDFNFVQGFRAYGGVRGSLSAMNHFFFRKQKWYAPKQGEEMGIITFNQFATNEFGKKFSNPFFDRYYTAAKIPSWEDNVKHARGLGTLKFGYGAAKIGLFGMEPMEYFRDTTVRLPFDDKELKQVGWAGFNWMGPMDIKYASNGVYGPQLMDELLERHSTVDALGVLMTYSVFSAHLFHNSTSGEFSVDMEAMNKYATIPGFARLGGKAKFVLDNNRLRTTEITLYNKTYVPSEDAQDPANIAFREHSALIGWRFAEKVLICSLVSQTNLVNHVKDLHLELAATFQVVTNDMFAADPTNPVRRLLDPFIHRSVQATNDNFQLLFELNAAEFSLAPLPVDEQLRLMDDFITEQPMVLAELDLENWAANHGMDPRFSTKEAEADSSMFFWRWHYRALTVERLYDTMIGCWVDANYGEGDEGVAALAADPLAQAWWQAMIKYVPSINKTVDLYPAWSEKAVLTPLTLRNVAKVLFTWLSWIHEDVGHAAAAYVYNPIHTPMAVPADGVGVAARSWGFNVAAYRGMVFLNRNKLVDEPPDFWFSGEADRKCFTDMQLGLRRLGETDTSFSECDKTGFYTCVERVETAVSS